MTNSKQHKKAIIEAIIETIIETIIKVNIAQVQTTMRVDHQVIVYRLMRINAHSNNSACVVFHQTKLNMRKCSSPVAGLIILRSHSVWNSCLMDGLKRIPLPPE